MGSTNLQWHREAIVCPKCWHTNYKFTWHNWCVSSRIGHLHVKCYKCGYEFLGEGRDTIEVDKSVDIL